MSADQALLSLLVVNIDYKLQRRETSTRRQQVGVIFDPIIRIFGSSDSGQRVCAHIHGVSISICGLLFLNAYLNNYVLLE